MYNYINVAIDEVAEAMLINQLTPHASLKDFLATSKIAESPAKHVSSSHVWAEVHQDYSYLRDLCIAIKEKASKEESNSIEQLMDGYIAAFDKDLWMLSQAVDD
ncbi:hypothetical protein MHBO_005232 [Bonamia ostreae]|uniref:Ferroxidase n=1 Tax=Bonamia ostreae TaxID=126728 RepID=A0ABV2AW67_9EUKA